MWAKQGTRYAQCYEVRSLSERCIIIIASMRKRQFLLPMRVEVARFHFLTIAFFCSFSYFSRNTPRKPQSQNVRFILVTSALGYFSYLFQLHFKKRNSDAV